MIGINRKRHAIFAIDQTLFSYVNLPFLFAEIAHGNSHQDRGVDLRASELPFTFTIPGE